MAPGTRQHRAGRIIAFGNFACASAYLTGTLAIHGLDIEAILDCLGILTRIGIAFFIAAFVARPLHDVVGGRATSWLVSNRRYLGLSFASWHLMHWPILACFLGIEGPQGFWEDFGDFFLPAIAILLLITAMAATSTDRSQQWMGMRRWSAFHTVGQYVIWSWAFRIYIRRMPDDADLHDRVYLWARSTRSGYAGSLWPSAW
jgi:DMSO/TMAO reductase YedYZ heme-binding membrane subunit